MKKEELQKKIIQFQILDANLRVLQERTKVLTNRIDELQKTKTAMDNLKISKPTKAMIPLGSGNFVFGRVDDGESIIVGAGAGVAIKKKKEEAIEILDSRVGELENSLRGLTGQSQIIVEQLEKLQFEIEKLQK